MRGGIANIMASMDVIDTEAKKKKLSDAYTEELDIKKQNGRICK